MPFLTLSQQRCVALGKARRPSLAVAELGRTGDAGLVAGEAIAQIDGFAWMFGLRRFVAPAASQQQRRDGQRQAMLADDHSWHSISAARLSVESSLAKQKRR